jgi:hypothetical protein
MTHIEKEIHEIREMIGTLERRLECLVAEDHPSVRALKHSVKELMELCIKHPDVWYSNQILTTLRQITKGEVIVYAGQTADEYLAQLPRGFPDYSKAYQA